MCFSATASFGAGAVLTAIGAVALKKTTKPQQLPFAGIPLLFAAQQFAEGFLWLSLQNSEYAAFKEPCTYLFLFFAQVFWPFWVPLSVLKLETNERKKKMLKIMFATGILVSLYFISCMMTFPVNGVIEECHIFYTFGYPVIMTPIVSVFYAMATMGSLMVSSVKGMKLFGISVFIAYLITGVFYLDYFVSVWCFFSAILSLIIVSVIYRLRPGVQSVVGESRPVLK